jgi:hypothetical protein
VAAPPRTFVASGRGDLPRDAPLAFQRVAGSNPRASRLRPSWSKSIDTSGPAGASAVRYFDQVVLPVLPEIEFNSDIFHRFPLRVVFRFFHGRGAVLGKSREKRVLYVEWLYLFSKPGSCAGWRGLARYVAARTTFSSLISHLSPFIPYPSSLLAPRAGL